MKSNRKLFGNDTSLFTIVKEKHEIANVLNNDRILISRWAYNWKILFNSDPNKPAQEVAFSRKKQFQSHRTISLNNSQGKRASYQKHIGITLDEKIKFKQHADNVISKINKGISVIKKLLHKIPRKLLITICKAFLRHQIVYGGIIYDQPKNESFREKIETIEYKAALAITGSMQVLLVKESIKIQKMI